MNTLIMQNGFFSRTEGSHEGSTRLKCNKIGWSKSLRIAMVLNSDYCALILLSLLRPICWFQRTLPTCQLQNYRIMSPKTIFFKASLLFSYGHKSFFPCSNFFLRFLPEKAELKKFILVFYKYILKYWFIVDS